LTNGSQMECYDSLYQTGTSIEATECAVHEMSLRQARMVGILNVAASCMIFLTLATAVWAVMH
jgi:hypothetical protein